MWDSMGQVVTSSARCLIMKTEQLGQCLNQFVRSKQCIKLIADMSSQMMGSHLPHGVEATGLGRKTRWNTTFRPVLLYGGNDNVFSTVISPAWRSENTENGKSERTSLSSLNTPIVTPISVRTTRRPVERLPPPETLILLRATSPVIGWTLKSSACYNRLMDQKRPCFTDRQPYHPLAFALMPDGMEPYRRVQELHMWTTP